MGKKRMGSKPILDRIFGNTSVWKALLDGLPAGILITDPKHEIHYMNPVLQGWLELPTNEIHTKRCHEVIFGSRQPCKSESGRCPGSAVFDTEGCAGPVPFTRKTQEGLRQHLQVTAHPILDEKGTSIYALEFFVDVTAQNLLTTYQEEAALRDPLTGLYNRQGFNHLFGRELKRAQRQGHALSLCLIDLDSFKDYNEKKGEKAGDDLLASFAGILIRQTRDGVDSLFRLEADTFSIILPETPHEQALRIGDRIRGAAEETPVPITFSMALCEAQRHEDPDTVFHRATDLLYEAKKAGGNRIL
jgi:diguanylate cyclase (GGDEF)-like protein